MKYIRTNIYNPYFLGVIYAILALNIWYLSVVAVENQSIPKSYDYIIKVIIGITSAFFGAYFALKLREYEENKKEARQRLNILNKCLFTLYRQGNAADCFKLEINKAKGRKHLDFPAIIHADYSALTQNMNELNFLIEFGFSRFLMNLSLEQERFELMLHTIKLRNELYIEKVQPMMNSVITRRAGFNAQIDEDALNAYNEMTKMVANCFDSIKNTIDELLDVHSKIYPNDRPLDVGINRSNNE